jgi:GH35 family endo-1,4-beta-xylanase
MEEMVQAFKSYPVPVVITELDVRLDNLGPNVSSANKLRLQAQLYSLAIQAAINSGNVKEISFGEAGDKYSWFVVTMNSPNADATVFDAEFNPKVSYYASLKALLN